MFRKVIYSLFLFCGLFLYGCIKSDPPENSDRPKASASAPREYRQLTRAPLEIDPTILATRSFGEAPMLAKLVARGELPPVSERLPENPLVVVPVEEIGTYGGTIRRALTDDTVQETEITKTLNENLLGYERPVARSIQLNLAESYQFFEDGKTAVFRIRKGIRWSDGIPFTVDDILFWYYDMVFDKNAMTEPFPPSEWLADGKPIKLEKVDDLTLKITSPKPLGRVLNSLCHDDLAQPKHIWAKYHPRYNAQATYDDFKKRTSVTVGKLVMEPGVPRLSAWVPVEWVRGQKVVYERNPYYWKVDSAGNQLPYADRLLFSIVPESQMILLKFTNGEIDLFGENFKAEMVAAAKAEEKRGRFQLRQSGPVRGPTLYLNWDSRSPALQRAFREKNVRIALSHAISREEIGRIAYNGLLVPSGYSFGPGSPYYSAEAARKYSSYDPQKSRVLLDASGYIDSDGDGTRELKDGSPFEVIIDVINNSGLLDICELVADHWKEIGIRVHLNPGKEEIIFPRRLNGEFDIFATLQRGAADPLDAPHHWVIWSPNQPFWHRNASKESPKWLREATAQMKRAFFSVDPKVRREAMVQVRDLHTENIPAIVIGFAYKFWGAHTRLGNVPVESSVENNFRGWPRPIFHEQIFIKQDPASF